MVVSCLYGSHSRSGTETCIPDPAGTVPGYVQARTRMVPNIHVHLYYGIIWAGQTHLQSKMDQIVDSKIEKEVILFKRIFRYFDEIILLLEALS